MHRLPAWLLLGLVTLLPGCAMSYSFARIVAVDPFHYEPYSDAFWQKIRNSRLADAAWERAREMAPQPYTRHYERGFKYGFTDYLRGGEGRVPLVPPRRYWAFYYQSPEGNEAMQDWFAGWRHGNAMAKESGYWNLMVIPTIYSADSETPQATDPKTGEPLKPEGLPPARPDVKPPGVERPTETKPEAMPPKPELPEPKPLKPEELPPRPTDPPKKEPPPADPPRSDPPRSDPPRSDPPGESYEWLVVPNKR
jgi:hypothetical protein